LSSEPLPFGRAGELPDKEIATTIGGLIGFGLAAAIAWTFLGYVLIILASTALVGIGAIGGSSLGRSD
jgi:hypothetical protein